MYSINLLQITNLLYIELTNCFCFETILPDQHVAFDRVLFLLYGNYCIAAFAIAVSCAKFGILYSTRTCVMPFSLI